MPSTQSEPWPVPYPERLKIIDGVIKPGYAKISAE
jgi:adenosine deaminase